jgi:hypothetical protein
LVVVAALAGAGASALAQSDTTNPYTVQEPNVSSAQVLRLPAAAPGCDSTRSVTVRVNPPTGAILGLVRVVVDGRGAARMTGIPRAASATVRVPVSGARVTVSAETLGGQQLRASRVYADCHAVPVPPSQGGGGEG